MSKKKKTTHLSIWEQAWVSAFIIAKSFLSTTKPLSPVD